MSSPFRTVGAAVLALGLAGAFGVGLVLAQSGDDDDSGGGSEAAESYAGYADGFLDRLAEKLDVPRDELDDAILESALEELDAAVEDGAIPEELADVLREHLESGELLDGFGLPRFHHERSFPRFEIRPFSGRDSEEFQERFGGDVSEHLLDRIDELLERVESGELPEELGDELRELRERIESGEFDTGRPFGFRFGPDGEFEFFGPDNLPDDFRGPFHGHDHDDDSEGEQSEAVF